MSDSVLFYDSSSMNQPHDMPNHIHSSYEIYYLETGRCRYLINNKLYEIEPDDIVFIKKEVIHKTTYPAEHSRLLINCSDEYLCGYEFPDFNVFRNKTVARKAYAAMKDVEDEYMKDSDEFSSSIIKSDIMRILSVVTRNENLYEKTRSYNRMIDDILAYVEENYAYDLSLSSVAEMFSMTHEHLSRMFKKETGVGFNEYLSLKRMNKAAHILKQNTDESISEVASRCGFDDSNYFCLKFKKTFGLSPLRYKKSFYP